MKWMRAVSAALRKSQGSTSESPPQVSVSPVEIKDSPVSHADLKAMMAALGADLPPLKSVTKIEIPGGTLGVVVELHRVGCLPEPPYVTSGITQCVECSELAWVPAEIATEITTGKLLPICGHCVQTSPNVLGEYREDISE